MDSAALRLLLAQASVRPWRHASQLPDGQSLIAQVVRASDTQLAVEAVNRLEATLDLQRVAQIVHERSVLGVTYLRKSDRLALAAALKALAA
jgi:5-enolpyruvylshikimate-3-phosphate synthase